MRYETVFAAAFCALTAQCVQADLIQIHDPIPEVCYTAP